MIYSIALLSWVATFIYFALFCNGGDPVIFISSLFLSILFTSFIGLKDKLKKQGEEIEKLKTHLGIKDDDPVNQNNENKND